MKSQIGCAVLLAGLLCPSVGQAATPEQQEFCAKYAGLYASWYSKARLNSPQVIEELQRLIVDQSRHTGTLSNRMRNRALSYIGTSVTVGEARADLYGLCINY